MRCVASSWVPPCPSRVPRCCLAVKGKHVPPLPGQTHRPAPGGKDLHRGGLEVLLGDDELATGVKGDDIARVRAQIDDVTNLAGRGSLVVRHGGVGWTDPDLLRADRV